MRIVCSASCTCTHVALARANMNYRTHVQGDSYPPVTKYCLEMQINYLCWAGTNISETHFKKKMKGSRSYSFTCLIHTNFDRYRLKNSGLTHIGGKLYFRWCHMDSTPWVCWSVTASTKFLEWLTVKCWLQFSKCTSRSVQAFHLSETTIVPGSIHLCKIGNRTRTNYPF